MMFEPLTEAQAIWLVRMLGGRVYHCRQCGRYMGAAYHARWQQRYCSNACRQKAYRLRHGQRHAHPGRPHKRE